MLLGFEEFEFDTERGELSRAGLAVEIKQQSLAILGLLLERRPQPVSKDELVERIWDGRAVSDDAIFAAFKKLRQALGDNGRDQRLVKTFYARGFAFVGDVERLDREQETDTFSTASLPNAEPYKRVLWRRGAMVAVALAVLCAVWIWTTSSDQTGSTGEADSVTIAILPLTSSGDDLDLGREIATSAITSLSDRPDFNVVSGTSVFSLAKRGLTASQIGQETGATHIIEGEVRTEGDDFEVDLRLVDTADERQLWSRTIRRQNERRNYLIDAVTRRSAAAIQAVLEVGAGSVEVPNNVAPSALADFRSGLEMMLSYDRHEPLLNQHRLFASVIEQAPNWGDAHGAYLLSLLHNPRDIGMTVEQQQDAFEKGLARARKVDPENRMTRLADGLHEGMYGSDHARAIAVMRELVADYPDWPDAHSRLARVLLIGGHYDEALVHLERRASLNAVPSRLSHYLRIQALRGLGKEMNSAALAQACKAQCYYLFLGWYEAILLRQYQSREELEQDLSDFEVAVVNEGTDQFVSDARLGFVFSEAAIATIRHLKLGGPRPEFVPGQTIVRVAVSARNGEIDQAFEHLEPLKAAWMPKDGVTALLYDDALAVPDDMRKDPRYGALFTSPKMKSVVTYRRAQGLQAGLPIAD